MFTGLVEDVGLVSRIEPLPQESGIRLWIKARLFDQSLPLLGASVAINGVCLTVVAAKEGRIAFEVGPESMAKTTLGSLISGSKVNLEQAMKMSDRLGGHLVSGHVDVVAPIVDKRQRGDNLDFTVEIPVGFDRYCIEKGSVCLDGISLTINRIVDRKVEVSIIPHTQLHTTLADKYVGELLNIEVDMIAKYVERLLGGRAQ